MSEEAVADSAPEVSEVAEAVVETEQSSPEGGNVFDMDGAVKSVGDDLFGKSEESDEPDEQEKPEKAEKKSDEEPSVKVEKKAEEAVKEEEKAEEKEPEKIDLPASWKKDMQEKWEKLDNDSQKYVIEREEQMRGGLEKDRGDANLGRTFTDMLKPYEQLFQQRGINAVQGVKALLSVDDGLRHGSLEQKQAIIQNLERSYGITKPAEGENPQIHALMQKVNQLSQNQQANEERSQQEISTRIQEEVETFSSTHPHFDSLEGDIAIFIRGGLSLEDAYDKDLNANQEIKDTEIERRVDERLKIAQEEAKKEAEVAIQAKSVNVKGRDVSKAPTGKLGTMEDTMRETYRKINRN